jgi:hypothetical protein
MKGFIMHCQHCLKTDCQVEDNQDAQCIYFDREEADKRIEQIQFDKQIKYWEDLGLL